ncbi:hypothetical protein BOTBODRAFT_142885 [Botryobasidium botryosum FD-172 SS1]|uniref:Amino acid permease/ SLC12A domain-containing protein n=1 Tax=Botryobasidium botryosum (strain FD-172 SS1) TaxID=930990 RepID=A0A067MU56_BOTB1|nr:hypothetical protein BOTBODRAFT_142885 [Botryobasidium botryosum FD-172 SS1]
MTAPGDTSFLTAEELESAKQDDIGAGSVDPNVLGAPAEAHNPLGYDVGFTSAVFLNLSQMIGVGIYSTPGSILKSVGSIGLFLILWLIGPLVSFAGLNVYNELASMFPKRSGAEVVYLEQAYPNPRLFVPITFAMTSVLLNFSAVNSIVFAQYMLDAFDIARTPFRTNLLGTGVATFAVAICCISTKWSLRLVNVITFIKVATLLFFALTGICVLAGLTSVPDPTANFRDPFEGSSRSGNALATGLVKISYTFLGWANANNVLAEVKGSDPVRTVRQAGYASLGIISVLYFFVNVAYVAAVPKEVLRESGQLAAAAFMRAVFGNAIAVQLLPLFIACSCIGNIIAVTIGHARSLREVARQGIMPYASFFSSTKPWGTPVAPILFTYVLTIVVMVAPPAEDAFSFLVDVSSYPGMLFAVGTAAAVWVLRRRRVLEGLAPAPFRASNIAVVVWLIRSVFLSVMPWVPPEGGSNGGDVSFWYATYCAVGLLIVAAACFYYYMSIVLLPRLGGYEIVEEVEELSDGALTKRLTRRYPGEGASLGTERTPLLDQRRQ